LLEITSTRVAVTVAGRAFLRRLGVALDQYLAQPAAVQRRASP
jgi:hypothetical protein